MTLLDLPRTTLLKQPPLERDDLKTLLFVSLLTVAGFAIVLMLPFVSSYEIRQQDVVMVIGWFVGGMMTWAWTRRRRTR